MSDDPAAPSEREADTEAVVAEEDAEQLQADLDDRAADH